MAAAAQQVEPAETEVWMAKVAAALVVVRIPEAERVESVVRAAAY